MTNEALIAKWKPVLDEASKIFTWTEPICASWLAEEASKAAFAAEIGVYMGYTSYVMLRANPSLHLWAIDPYMVAGTRMVTEYWLRDFIAEGRCEIIPKFTKEATAQLEHMKGKLDLLNVDDGHAIQDVITDITCSIPLLRPGGMLCGHDYELSPVNEVAQAVIRLLPNHTQPVPRYWAWTKPA